VNWRIVLTRRYVTELEEQLVHIAQDKPQAALRMAQRVGSVVRLLAQNPELGREGRIQGTRELVIARTPHLACYRLTLDRVEMLLFRHGRRRWPQALPRGAGDLP